MTRIDTILPADSVEFCPLPTATQIFAVGTYQLVQAVAASSNPPDQINETVPTACRRGTCLVFQADPQSDECTQVQEIPMAAVLDMKWASRVLAVADAEGQIVLHHWREHNRRLECVQTLRCNSESEAVLCLSLDWCMHRSDQNSGADKMSASLSNGSIIIARQSDTGMTVSDTWLGHEFEPWITAWDRWDQNFIYTGGDDCSLKGWDLRATFARPALLNKRFEAGVTAIQSNPHSQYMLAVGSYDSTVRLFDTRQFTRPLIQSQVGGGAWRVKWHPDAHRKMHLLVACMHDGFKVMDFGLPASNDSNTSPSWRIAARYDEHQSLAYGVDWSYGPANKDGSLVASCSFYDHSLHLWRG